jgi:hypothetical protein
MKKVTRLKFRRHIRRSQLVADAVAVLCPYCAEPQPNPSDGSEQWTAEDFLKVVTARRTCVACDVIYLISSDSKVMFQGSIP